MKPNEKLIIRTPGSTANLGPGFDSVGLAVNRYLTLEVTQSEAWEFVPKSDELRDIPTGEDNLVYLVAEKVANQYGKELLPCRVEMSSEIPMSRGMGSSASAIVAGIELANQLLQLNLTPKEKLRIASLHEGHPDNVAPSIYGGLVIGSHREDETDIVFGGIPTFDIVALIPDYELKTSMSRSVLPKQLSYEDAVKASSISNVLIAALLQKDYELAGKMMDKDMFHQQYRGTLVPELAEVRKLTAELGAYGVTLSGAGPIVLTFSPQGTAAFIKEKLSNIYKDGYRIDELQIDEKGVTAEIEVMENTGLR